MSGRGSWIRARFSFIPIATMFKYILTLLLASFTSVSVSAQVRLALVPLPVASDTMRVTLELGTSGERLPEPVTSFQFIVTLDGENVQFNGLESEWTLSGSPGWTARANPENGRTGGFSSSLDAIESGGVLGILVFHRQPEAERDCEDVTVTLREFKLNSGSPSHDPKVPSINVSNCETQ